MYLVTFRLSPGEYDDEFHGLTDAIQAVAEETDGYRGKRTWNDPESDEVLVVYYWDSLDAFGADATHKRAKGRWAEWYDAYEVTVTEVLERYGRGFGDTAGPPASQDS